MKKRILAILFVSVLLVSGFLTACGGGGTSTAAADPAAPAAEGDAAPAAEGDAAPAEGDAAPAESGTLSVWTWKVAMQPGFRDSGAKFAETSGFDVAVEAFTPDDTYRQKVIAAANSGDLPDVIHWWATRGYGFENALVNMGEVATEEYMAQFHPAAFNESIVRDTDVTNWANDAEKDNVTKSLKAGDLYQIPLDMGGFFTIFANNAILSEVGLADQVPANYDQFIEYAKKVADETEKGGFVFAGGLPDVYYNWMGRAVEAMYYGAETSVDILNRRATMAEHPAALQAFGRLADAGAILEGAVAMDIDAGDMAFAAGEAAYLLGGSFTYGQLSAMGMDVTQVFSFLVPMLDGGAVTEPFALTPFSLTALMIPLTSEHQDVAMDYINYIALDPEGATIFANGAYTLPAATLDDATIASLSPALQDMYNGFSPEINVTSEVDNWPGSLDRGDLQEYELLYADMQQIMMGEMTAEQAAANFDTNAAAQAAAGQ